MSRMEIPLPVGKLDWGRGFLFIVELNRPFFCRRLQASQRGLLTLRNSPLLAGFSRSRQAEIGQKQTPASSWLRPIAAVSAS